MAKLGFCLREGVHGAAAKAEHGLIKSEEFERLNEEKGTERLAEIRDGRHWRLSGIASALLVG
jgi:hypothetical protein